MQTNPDILEARRRVQATEAAQRKVAIEQHQAMYEKQEQEQKKARAAEKAKADEIRDLAKRFADWAKLIKLPYTGSFRKSWNIRYTSGVQVLITKRGVARSRKRQFRDDELPEFLPLESLTIFIRSIERKYDISFPADQAT